MIAERVEAKGGGQVGPNAAGDLFELRPDQVADVIEFDDWLRTPPRE